MITALDSSVLLDILLEDPKHRDRSLAALRAAHAAGVLLACPVVWSEVRAALREPKRIGEHLGAAGIRFDPFDEACADLAGDLWRAYRRAGGRREHLIPDFLIGAHAKVRADRLLARDRGFFGRRFPGLVVVDPARA
jgi:predicted nucleic acid-binding protein